MLTWHNSRLSYAMNDGVSHFLKNLNQSSDMGRFYLGMRNAACQVLGH